MAELKIEHVLMFVIVAFVLYHFVGRCSCGNGFSVGFDVNDDNGNKSYTEVDAQLKWTDNICGYQYKNGEPVNCKPGIPCSFKQCKKKVDGKYVNSPDDICLCQKGNTLYLAEEGKSDICMPESGNNSVTNCYDKTNIKNLTTLLKTVPL